jgi:hypothetical protein
MSSNVTRLLRPLIRRIQRLWKPARKKRLLIVYDLSLQPFSIGDILVFQEASLILREQYEATFIDFALMYDAERPATDPVFSSITADNIMYHVTSLLPVTQVNQYLGSLFVFNCQAQLERFITDTPDVYHVWPDIQTLRERKYLYYEILNDIVHTYHQKHQMIPTLSCRGFLLEWARTFYDEHMPSSVPVTVQIRNNKLISPERNLRLDCWFELFRYCEGRYPVKFVIVCALPEIDERMRDFANVIIAKDFGTSVEQDLALIQTAAIHMGAASGPGTIAIFNMRPYLLVNTNAIVHLYRCLEGDGDSLRFTFGTQWQTLTRKPETAEFLISEFERMWAAIDKTQWESGPSPASKVQREALTWLR